MTKTLLFGGIGFLIGFAGATAGVALRGESTAPPAVALRDTASVERIDNEAHAGGAAGAADSAATTSPEAAAPSGGATRPATPVLDAAIASARRRASAGRTTERAARADLPDNEASRRLAKIFGAMEPEDAARVLELLDDDAIQSILLELADRKAAAILGSIEPARAASISRAVLAGGAE